MRTKKILPVPIPVERTLKKLGVDLRDARRRRRLPVALIAERAGISRMTLHKIERGDGGVALASYACVLYSLGLIERLSDLADHRFDSTGLMLEESELPKRIRNVKMV